MDYEKVYKEALERARIAHKDEDKHLKATLERIFPELKESEMEQDKLDLIYDKLSDIYKILSKSYQDIKQPVNVPSNPMQCWFPDGTCMNPLRDCVNCPRRNSTGTYTTTSIDPSKVMHDGIPINNQEKK